MKRTKIIPELGLRTLREAQIATWLQRASANMLPPVSSRQQNGADGMASRQYPVVRGGTPRWEISVRAAGLLPWWTDTRSVKGPFHWVWDCGNNVELLYLYTAINLWDECRAIKIHMTLHVNGGQKPLQYSKVISLQLKLINQLKKFTGSSLPWVLDQTR